MAVNKPKRDAEAEGVKEDLADFTRRHVEKVIRESKRGVELTDKPTALLAIKVADLKRGYVDVQAIDTEVKVEVDDQRDWITRHEADGFQLVFVLDGSWKLFDNTTGVSDDIVLEILSLSDLQDFWEENHPVESHREILEKMKGPKGYLQ